MLLWLDLETTGLVPEEDQILEVAWFVTTDDMAVRTTPITSCVVRQSEPAYWHQLQQNPFVYDMHERTGLLAEIEAGENLVLLEDVEDEICRSVDKSSHAQDVTMLAGSSPHFDLSFIRAQMPRLFERLSHRIFDVTTLKTLFMPVTDVSFDNEVAHRAISDIENSFKYAQHYQETLKKGSN